LTAATESPREALLERIVEWFAAHGVLDTSLRSLAAGVGTSSRMLNYHFGSRDELLAAVVTKVCDAERQALEDALDGTSDPLDACRDYWDHLAESAQAFAPLFYELSAHAMYGKDYARGFRRHLTDAWLGGFRRAFLHVTDADHAEELAGLSVAVGRGVLFDMALTGDRDGADAAIETYVDMVRRSLEGARSASASG